MRTSRFLSFLHHNHYFRHHRLLFPRFLNAAPYFSDQQPSTSTDTEDRGAGSSRSRRLEQRYGAGSTGYKKRILLLSGSGPGKMVSADAVSIRSTGHSHQQLVFRRHFFKWSKEPKRIEISDIDEHSHRAVRTALWCNFLVFSLKFGVWLTTSSHVMLAEVVHSVADFANQVLLAYGLTSSRRAPDAIHPYGYSKERFVWALISATGIFCLGSGGTIVHGIQNMWTAQPPEHVEYAALVIGGSFILEGASLLVAIHAVRKGAAAEGMTLRDYIWRGHDPTAVAVMTEVTCVQNWS
ncbi:Metal tolerance protein C4-like protein [Drosera capensis]